MWPAPEVKPEPKKGKAQTAQSQGRARITVRRLQPAEPMAYAQQPFFGGYRPMLCFVLQGSRCQLLANTAIAA